MRSYGAGGEEMATSSLHLTMECRDAPAERLEQVLVALDQNSTIIAVLEMSQSSWLVAGMLPGIERQPRKKLEPSPERLLAVLHGWRDEVVRAGRTDRARRDKAVVESPGGLSPPGAPRSVREPLDSYGSRCSAV